MTGLQSLVFFWIWESQFQYYFIFDVFLFKQSLKQSLDLCILKTIDFVLPDVILLSI